MRALVFTSAVLSFSIQPLAAARVLPAFGGGAIVWTASLLVFQGLLVLAYALGARVPVARWARVLPFAAVVALGLSFLAPSPVRFSASAPLGGADLPVLRLVAALLVDAGPGYLLVAASLPLLTAAARADHRLFAISNAGSIVGLLLPTFVLDPLVGRAVERGLWWMVFAAWAVAASRALRGVSTGAAVSPGATVPPGAEGEAPRHPRALTPGSRLVWLAAGALGTGLLTTMTAALSQDLSAGPLLWVPPLLVYLATFIVAFGPRRLPGRGTLCALAALAVAGLIGLLLGDWRLPWQVQLFGHLGVLFVLALAVHVEAVRRRPADAHLGTFYLHLAAGGALGTLITGLVAPALSPVPLELPAVAIALWLFLLPSTLREAERLNPLRPPLPVRATLVAVTVALVLGVGVFAARRLRGDATWTRSVYGALQLRTFAADEPDRALRHLLDGRISHGFQFLSPEKRRLPTAYFGPQTGIGRLLSPTGPGGPTRDIAVFGLGIGTLAAYGRPGDVMRFFELNPAAVSLAQAPFTFLADSRARVEIVPGDARVSLEARSEVYDVIVLDAFSGDALPLHLLTEEAVALYLSRLSSDGVLAVNLSNRHADLARVLHAHAERFSLATGSVTAVTRSPLGPYRSDWAFLAFTPEAVRFATESLPGGDAPVRFTDDHAPLLAVLR